MNTIFYNIASILIGAFLLFLPITKLIKHTFIKFDILFLGFSPMFLFIGIFGFFISEDYSYLTIIVMLSLCVIMILLFILFSRVGNKKDSQ
jgi:hypothetical protein